MDTNEDPGNELFVSENEKKATAVEEAPPPARKRRAAMQTPWVWGTDTETHGVKVEVAGVQ